MQGSAPSTGTRPGGECWAIEVKRSLAPKVERGFHSACEDLKPTRRFVVCPGTEVFALGHGIEAAPLAWLCRAVVGRR